MRHYTEQKGPTRGLFAAQIQTQSLAAKVAFQTEPVALLRFENTRIIAAFHAGIPTPVSMGDAMLIL